MATPTQTLTPEQSHTALQTLLNGPAGLPPAGVIPNFNNPQNQDTIQYVTTALTLSFATCAVIIRIYTKRFLLRSMGFEDYVSVIAWISFVGFAVPCILGHKNGAGTHYWNLRLGAFSRLLYWINIVAITYAITMTFVKLSILLQYLRIFVPSREGSLPLFTAIHACIWSTVIFYLLEVFILIFECSPREKIWNPLITTGHCFNSIALYQASGVFNVLSDFAILILPLPTVWNLQMSLRRRLLLMGVFATGLFASVASILRTYYTWRVVETSDVSWEIFPVGLWSWAELSIGIIVGCLPTLPKFFQHVGTKFYRITSGSGGKSSAADYASKLSVFARVQRPFSRYGVGRRVSDFRTEPYNPRPQSLDEYYILEGFAASPTHVRSSITPTGWRSQGIATAREDLEYAQEIEMRTS